MMVLKDLNLYDERQRELMRVQKHQDNISTKFHLGVHKKKLKEISIKIWKYHKKLESDLNQG